MKNNILRIVLVLALVVATGTCARKEFAGERCSAPAVGSCAGCKIRCMRNEVPECKPGVMRDGACAQRSNCDCT